MNEQLWHDLRATGAVFLVDLGQGGGIQALGLGVGSQTALTVARVSLTCSMSCARCDIDTENPCILTRHPAGELWKAPVGQGEAFLLTG